MDSTRLRSRSVTFAVVTADWDCNLFQTVVVEYEPPCLRIWPSIRRGTFECPLVSQFTTGSVYQGLPLGDTAALKGAVTYRDYARAYSAWLFLDNVTDSTITQFLDLTDSDMPGTSGLGFAFKIAVYRARLLYYSAEDTPTTMYNFSNEYPGCGVCTHIRTTLNYVLKVDSLERLPLDDVCVQFK